MVPHEGHVHLQQACGQKPARVVHSLTMEGKELPIVSGQWALSFVGGYGAVADEDGQHVIELDDLL